MVLNLTSMYASRMRHNLDKSAVKKREDNQTRHRLLERCDEQLDDIEWSRIHEFVWRPNHTNGLGRKECQKLRLSILDDLVKRLNVRGDKRQESLYVRPNRQMRTERQGH